MRKKRVKSIDKKIFKRTANRTAKANVLLTGRGGIRL